MNAASITLRTFTGIEVPLLVAQPEHIRLADIARGLSMSARFAGQTQIFYSVAEHSVNVAGLLRTSGYDADVVRAGLLHDAAEAYVGDVTSPTKRALRHLSPGLASPYDALEAGLMCAIAEHFRIAIELFDHPAVKRADMRMLEIENEAVRGLPFAGTDVVDTLVGGTSPAVFGLTHGTAEKAFLKAAELLGVADA